MFDHVCISFSLIPDAKKTLRVPKKNREISVEAFNQILLGYPQLSPTPQQNLTKYPPLSRSRGMRR